MRDCRALKAGRMEGRSLCVAAVQMCSVVGDVEGNLRRAECGLARAAQEGAALALLPDLFACGSAASPALSWESAEPFDGPTRRRVRVLAAQHQLYVGFTFLEARPDAHVFNTFVLVSPDGKEWTCRKTKPVATEAFIFASAPFESILKTPIGTFGVQICHESLLRQHQAEMLLGAQHLPNGGIDLDLLLLPFSVASPPPGLGWSAQQAASFDELVISTATRQAQLFSVPVVAAHKVGPAAPASVVLPLTFWVPTAAVFPGHSSVCSGRGVVLAECGGADPGVAVARVRLGSAEHLSDDGSPLSASHSTPSKAARRLVELGGGGAQPYSCDLPAPLPLVFSYVVEPVGRLSYHLSRARRRAAIRALTRALGGAGQPPTRPGSLGTLDLRALAVWEALLVLCGTGLLASCALCLAGGRARR